MESKWKRQEALFLCPICGRKMALCGSSLICDSRHCFDISRKGYLNFVQNRCDKIYSSNLFKNREQLYKHGFYDRVFDRIESAISEEMSILPGTVIIDAGCGEGSLLTRICNEDGIIKIGVDISKDAITCACRKSKEIIWLVADLVRIPLKSHSVDVVCNFLSPANYDSFHRILKPGGILVKVIAGKSYLKEFRELASFQVNHKSYDEQRVIRCLEKNMKVIKTIDLEYQVDVNKTQLDQWMKMTPMLVNSDPDHMREAKIDKVTISMTICICKNKE